MLRQLLLRLLSVGKNLFRLHPQARITHRANAQGFSFEKETFSLGGKKVGVKFQPPSWVGPSLVRTD